MSLITLAKIVFDVTLIALLLLGYLNEDKVIAWEQKAAKRVLKRFRKTRICKEINRMIRAHEMAHQEVRR